MTIGDQSEQDGSILVRKWEEVIVVGQGYSPRWTLMSETSAVQTPRHGIEALGKDRGVAHLGANVCSSLVTDHSWKPWVPKSVWVPTRSEGPGACCRRGKHSIVMIHPNHSACLPGMALPT